MNLTQHIIVLTGVVAIAILFHVYFCDWQVGTGDPFLSIFEVKVEGEKWRELNKVLYYTRRREIESLSSQINRSILREQRQRLRQFAAYIDEIDDSSKYDAVFGLYPNRRLLSTFVGPAYRTAFVFVIIFPIVILAVGVFVAVGSSRNRLKVT